MKLLSLASLVSLSAVSLAFAGDAPPTAPPAAPLRPLAAATCFELSATGTAWSRTPELLCVGPGTKNIAISMKTGLPTNPKTIATFHLDLANRARCLDCNKDEFALSNPSNSVFNALAIKFEGKRQKTGAEAGTVWIGKTKFHYRRK